MFNRKNAKNEVTGKEGASKIRWRVVLGATFFVVVFQWVYASYLSPVWGYLGFAYNFPTATYLLIACGLAILPSVWMPIGITRPSQLMYWLVYITVYIPSILVSLYAALLPANDVAWLHFSLFIGFAVMGLSYLRPLLKIRPLTGSNLIFWYTITAITIGLTFWVLYVYTGHFQLVSFASVYELRFSSGEVGAGTGVGYATMVLAGAILPFLLAWALFYRRWLVFILGALGELMLYGASGSKGTLLAILFVPGIYIYLKGRVSNFGLRLIWSAGLILVVLNLPNLLPQDLEPDLAFSASSVGIVRTFAIPGLATAQYQKFFSSHPYTYYSHVKGINLLKEYPYERSLGEVVGFEFYNSDQVDWNASLWSTDGLAALGLPGIILISILCSLLFWVLDSTANGHDPGFTALVCCYGAINIANTSLFTSFLSGGLGFLVLLFFVMPRKNTKSKVDAIEKPLSERALVQAPMVPESARAGVSAGALMSPASRPIQVNTNS